MGDGRIERNTYHWRKNRKSDNDDTISINIGLRPVLLEGKLNKARIKLHKK